MAFNLSAADKVLKVRYLGPIREQLNNATILMSRIMKDSSTQSVSGKSFTVPLHIGRNNTAGSGRDDGGTLPSAANQSYEQAIVPNKYLYARIEVTGPTIAATRDNIGAFVTAVDSEIQGAVRDMKRAMNRQLHSDGIDALGYFTGADDTGDFTADDNRGNAFVHFPISGTVVVDVLDASSSYAVIGDDVTVALGAKGSTSYTITVSAGSRSGTADGDPVVLADTKGFQMMGLAGIVDDADPPLLSGGLHSLPVASNAWWKSIVFDASGTNRDLTLELLQQPLDEIASVSDYTEADIKFLLCSYGVRAKYISLLVQEKRFVNTMELDGGFKGVEFNGIPLVPDPQCRKNRIYYVNPEVLRIFRTADFDWMDRDGAILSRVANKDSYEAVLFHYGDLGCIARNGLALLDDITE